MSKECFLSEHRSSENQIVSLYSDISIQRREIYSRKGSYENWMAALFIQIHSSKTCECLYRSEKYSVYTTIDFSILLKSTTFVSSIYHRY